MPLPSGFAAPPYVRDVSRSYPLLMLDHLAYLTVEFLLQLERGCLVLLALLLRLLAFPFRLLAFLLRLKCRMLVVNNT